MSTWVIIYRGADRQERELVAQASGALTEQGAAMIVSEFLRLQNQSQALTALSPSTLPEHYNFQIVGIRKEPDCLDSPK